MPTQAPYSVVGNYRGGVWLVAQHSSTQGNVAMVVDRAHLPKVGTGWQYYWLGSNQAQASSRILDALTALNFQSAAGQNLTTPVRQAFAGQVGQLTPVPTGILGQIRNALNAGGVLTTIGPGATLDTIGGGAGAAGAADAAAGAGGASLGTKIAGGLGLAGVAGGIGSSLDFLKWIAWIFHPNNILRAVEFLTGLVLMFYGMQQLLGGMRRSAATHRSGVTSMVRSLFNKTPMGRARQVTRARKRGRRAGELQAERDTEYRGARQQRARELGAYRRTRPGGGSGVTGGTGE